MKPISSRHNERVKRAQRLRASKGRREQQRFLVDGGRDVARALATGWRPDEAFFCKSWSDPDEARLADELGARCDVFELSESAMERVAYGQRRTGLAAAFATRPSTPLDKLSLSDAPLVVLLDRVAKPGNLGAVMRTCDAAGADALVLVDAELDRFNANVIRASTGAVFHVACAEASLDETLAWLKQHERRAFGTWVDDAARDYATCDWRDATYLVFGAEDQGLRDPWRTLLQPVTIPMLGDVGDSLNLSNAVAVCLFEAARQRRTNPRTQP